MGKLKKRLSGVRYLPILSIPAICLIALLLSGCSYRKTGTGGKVYQLFFLNKDITTIQTTDYYTDTTGVYPTAAELLDKLAQPASEVGYFCPVNGFEVEDISYRDEILTLDLSEEYPEQDKIHELLVRAAIVNTLSQISGVSGIEFTVAGEPFTDEDGHQPGVMNAQQFIYSSEGELTEYEKRRLTLYFANRTGDGLIAAEREVVHDSKVSLERLTTELLLAGPEEGEGYPTLNPETRILSVTLRDRICYLNLDQSFSEGQTNVTPYTAFYSLVNTLTSLPEIDRVRIQVNGDSAVSFMEVLPLDQTYEFNETLVRTE